MLEHICDMFCLFVYTEILKYNASARFAHIRFFQPRSIIFPTIGIRACVEYACMYMFEGLCLLNGTYLIAFM